MNEHHFPKIGKLYIIQIIYSYSYTPILFLCKSYNNKKLYLCRCCKLNKNWLIAEITWKQVYQLAIKQITLFRFFKQARHKWFVDNKLKLHSYIPKNAFPRKKAYINYIPCCEEEDYFEFF